MPSRLHPGQFYALPQAPQQFKQLIMVAGFDRYFQIAPCFRDEDARADRSPGEFYQLDIEMSFVTQEDVFAAIEPVLHGVFEEFANGRKVRPRAVPAHPYAEAMLKYGSDKPDLRNPIRDRRRDGACSRARTSPSKRSRTRPCARSRRRARARQPRSFFDKLNEWARRTRARRASAISCSRADSEAYRAAGSSPARARSRNSFPKRRSPQLAEQSGVKAGDALFFAADKPDRAAALAVPRARASADELDLIEEGEFKFCWVVDFPMYEWNEDDKRIDFSHNPFSMPQFDREKFLELGQGRQGHDPGHQGVPVRHRLQRR